MNSAKRSGFNKSDHWSDGVAYFAEVASAAKAKLECWNVGSHRLKQSFILSNYNTPILHYSNTPAGILNLS
jgi:hypothetical protein